MQKSLDERIAAAKAKKERADARLNALEAKAKTANRKKDTRRKIIVGGAVLAHMQKDAQFAWVVARLLDSSVGRQIDREAVADLLPAKQDNQSPAGRITLKTSTR